MNYNVCILFIRIVNKIICNWSVVYVTLISFVKGTFVWAINENKNRGGDVSVAFDTCPLFLWRSLHNCLPPFLICPGDRQFSVMTCAIVASKRSV